MRKSLIILAVLGFQALALPPAHAASSLEPPDLARYVRWGPLRARPGMELSNIGYDNNIFLDDSNKVGDYRATLSPKLGGLVLFGSRGFFRFTERFDYTGYLENTDQNFLDHRGRGRLTVPLGKFGVFGEYRLDKVHLRPLDQEDLRPEQKDHRFGAGFIFELGWRTEVEIAQTRIDLAYTDDDNPDISDRLDRQEVQRRLNLDYRWKGRTTLTLDIQTKDIDFRNDDPLKDSDEWSILPGITLGSAGRATGSLRFGWANIDAFNPDRPDFSDLVGDVEFSYLFGGGTRVELAGERIPGFTVVGEQTYYISTGGSGRGIRYLNPLIGIEAGVAIGRLSFPEAETDGSDRVDRLREYDIGIRLRVAENSLGRKTEYSIRLVRSERKSTQESQNRERTTIAIGAVLGF